MKLLFVWLFFVWIIQSTAIFEEQLGEYDWRKENMGFIEKSIQFEEKLIVSTSENILACIDARSGVPLWRVYMSPTTTVDKLLVVEGQTVLTLTKQVTSKDVSISLARGWSLYDGGLRWESSVGAPTLNSSGSLSDMMFDNSNSLLTVLSDNCLHFISLERTADVVVSSWSWSPAASNSSIDMSSLVISALIVPTKLSASHFKRIAVGCTVLSGECEEAVILKVNLRDSKISTDFFSGVSRFSPENLRASVFSDAETSYSEDDVIFSSVRPGKNEELSSLNVLSLTSGEIFNLSTGVVPQRKLFSLHTFIHATIDDKTRPAMFYCWTHTSVSECVAGILVRVTGVWEWQTVVSNVGSGDAEPLSSSSLQSASFYGDLAFAVHCVSAVWESNSSYSVLKTLVVNSSSRSSLSVPLNIQHPAPSQMSGSHSTSFRHVSVLKRPNSLDKNIDEFRVLLVLHSGLTLFLEASSLGQRVVWNRDEGLARIQQVALVDVDKHYSESSVSEGSSDNNNLPSLVERYVQQAEELKSFIFGFVDLRPLARIAILKNFPDNTNSVIRRLFDTVSVSVPKRDLSKMRLFGFDKTAVALCHSAELTDGEMLFRQAGVKLVAFSLLEGESFGWTAYPILDGEDVSVTFVKLLTTAASATRGSFTTSVTLVVGTTSGHTLTWCFDAKSGKQCGFHSLTMRSRATSTKDVTVSLVSIATKIIGFPASSVVRLSQTDSTDQPSISIVHQNSFQSVSVTRLSMNSAKFEKDFLHNVDRSTGLVNIFQVSGEECRDYEVYGPMAGALHCSLADLVASVVFPVESETIVDVSYRNSMDVVNSRSSILGDDSVLLKYLNPNVVLISTISPPQAAVHPYHSSNFLDEAGHNESSVLTFTLVDTVTGKVIKRISHEGAGLPLHVVLVEHSIVATFWNIKGKRTELSSTALYEGVIDKYGLGPLASSKSGANPAPYRAAAHSAYSGISPMAVQKTYTLPRAVTALSHTLTMSGVSNKNILIAFRSGQVFSVDMRQIHPRRPMSDPSQSEKEEGLLKYNPFLVMNPHTALTYNYTLLGHGASQIVSAPSALESSSLVLSFGGGVDFHVNRALPSQGFDLLSSDFNHALLVGILLMLALAVLVLRRMHQKKQMKTIWA